MGKIKFILGIIIIGVLTISCSSGGGGSEGPTSEVPLLTTSAATNINGLDVTLGGYVSSDGNSPIFQYGVCWDKIPNPTVSSHNTTYSAEILGDFSITTSVFEPNTLYYVRAFAVNSNGTAYGNQITFTSGGVLVANMPTDILTKSLVFRLSIPTPPANMTECGYCVNTSPNPTASNTRYTSTGGIGDISYPATGFTPNTTYYAKPYLINSDGNVFYGDQVSFKTCGYFGASGGYVFYDKGEYTNGWRYMELAPVTLNYTSSAVGAKWGCNTTFLSFTYPDFGKGYENTQRMLTGCADANSAARMCDNYVSATGGLSDWFLPSKEELFTIYKSLKYEGFINSTYDYIWSSTEYDATTAFQVWFINADHAQPVNEPKSWSSVITPVRRF